MRHQFTVDLDARQDALARLLDALATRGIDVREVGIGRPGRRTTAVLMTNNDRETHDVLRAEHYQFIDAEVVITSVADTPGAMARLIRAIAEAGIVVHGLSLLRWHQGKAELALSVDNPEELRRMLGSHTPN